MIVTGYLTIRTLETVAVWVDRLNSLLFELNAQGRNLIQLTTLANIGRIFVLRRDDLIGEYIWLCDTLDALVREVRRW